MNESINQGLVKGAILSFRNLYFYFRHGESTSKASQLTSPASQKSKDLNKVLHLLQDLGGGLVLESFADGALSRTVETKCLLYLRHLVSIGRLLPRGKAGRKA